MRLTTFSVSRYRSIIDAEKINIGDQTVLIGRNNEGKSNVLRALKSAIDVIKFHGSAVRSSNQVRIVSRRTYQNMYDWERDFPIQLLEGRGNQKTRFRLDFELDDTDTTDFKDIIGSAINSTLPIEINIGSTG